MKLTELSKQPSPWLRESGPLSEVVISSRIRLARNLADYEFKPCLTPERKKEILEIIKNALLALPLEQPLFFIDVEEAAPLERDLLAERYLISLPHARSDGPRGVVVAQSEHFSAMINEEDHLRMQVFAAAQQLEKCFEQINRIDTLLETKVPYAFHPRYGYLTACPTNLGTGIRVSVMLHLPALKMTGQIEKFFNAARDCNLAVRGLFGEGSEAVGDFYQLSNQVTLGVSEMEIVENFSANIVPKIVDYERVARRKLLEETPEAIDDKIQRSLAILRSARLVSSQEALILLSHVRLGIHTGRITDIPLSKINELFLYIQPAHLQMQAGRSLTPDQRDSLRAQIIRTALSVN
ncbi:MAG: protein arginine kinase [Phycisphaerae bacterium]|jgi:protein arginine kinase|nr:protein arginine kinase [Phycisphaerae bacterium]